MANGVKSNRIVRFNNDGTIDGSFVTGDGFDNDVLALAIQPDGKIVVGGKFQRYDGEYRMGLARLNEDGSLDSTFNVGRGVHTDQNGWVHGLAIQKEGWGNSGTAGAASTFIGTNFNLSAGGGGGGQGLPNGNDSGAGTGGSASGGDTNWSGGAGGNGQRNSSTNTNKNPNPGADGNGAGGGCSGADDPDAGGVTALGKGGDGSVDRLGPFGCGGGGGGAIDYGGGDGNGTHPASNQDNVVHGGLGYRNGGHGSRLGRPPRDGQGPYAGQKGLENWNTARMNNGSGGGYPGGGGGGGSDERFFSVSPINEARPSP